MAENTEKTKELNSTQEGIIVGLVLLFFGLLYWYLNPWQSEQKSRSTLVGQPIVDTIQSNSLASTNYTQAPTTTEVTTSTTQTQTVATNTVNNTATNTTATTTQTNIATQATTPTSTTAPTATNVTPAVETIASTSKVTTDTTQLPSPSITNTQTVVETAVAPKTQTPKATEIPPPTQISETTVKPADTTTTTAKPEPVQPTTTNMVNKLELAPNSPEAKLQSYLEKKTLETPVSMDGINFEAKTAKLTKESDAAVLLLAALLAQYPEANFLITSYTTETGDKNQNSDELSLIRAQTLGKNLVKAGVNGKRITIMGMGKRPSPDPTSVASKKSQHIEISVIQ